MSNEEQTKLLQSAVDKLGEHFDAVQILVSYNKEGDTAGGFRGTGNWYARIGLAREFLLQDEQRALAHEIAQAISTDEE